MMRRLTLGIASLLLCLVAPVRPLWAAIVPGAIVRAIEISGHRRTQEATIRFYLKTEIGSPYSPQVLREDIKRLYALRVFSNIQVFAEEVTDGIRLNVVVSEKPTTRAVTFAGNRLIEKDEIEKHIVLQKRATFDQSRLNDTVTGLQKYYRQQGYYFAHVRPQVTPVDDNQVDVHLQITEGKKLRVNRIRFTGNTFFTDATLRRALQSREFIMPLLSGEASIYRPELLRVDLQLLENFYKNNGFIHAQIGEPVIEINREASAIMTTIPIVEEGEQYKIGKVVLQGDEVFTEAQLRGMTQAIAGEVYSRDVIQRDIQRVTEAYTDRGYAFADVTPTVDVKNDTRLIHLTYTTRPGPRVYIGRIDITGNERTRDWVVRREMRIAEGELYSGSKLRRSRQRLDNLQYFEEVKIDTKRRSEEGLMDLEVEVTEQSTGQFTAGVGFSSVETFVFTASVSQRNLFGRGQSLSAQARIGGLSQDFTLSFEEPWLFGKPVSAGASLFRRTAEFRTFNSRRTGFALTLGRSLGEFTRASVTYGFEELHISDLDPSVSDLLEEQEGSRLVSTMTPRLVRDSRNNRFNPSGGSVNSVEVEVAGLGGDSRFYKLIGDSTWYYPLPLTLTGLVRARVGFAAGYGGKNLPASERFFLGGPTTVRGFDFREIGPEDLEGNPLGGTTFLQFNLEFGKSFGRILRLVAFLDAGNVYEEDNKFDFGELRRSVGFGVRVLTPVGPIRLDWGFKLDRRSGESAFELGFLLGSF
jgi:outer membrane protein insertion porin family